MKLDIIIDNFFSDIVPEGTCSMTGTFDPDNLSDPWAAVHKALFFSSETKLLSAEEIRTVLARIKKTGLYDKALPLLSQPMSFFTNPFTFQGKPAILAGLLDKETAQLIT